MDASSRWAASSDFGMYLVPVDDGGSVLEGILRLGAQEERVRISRKGADHSSPYLQVHCSSRAVCQLFQSERHRAQLARCNSAEELAGEVRDILGRSSLSDDLPTSSTPTTTPALTTTIAGRGEPLRIQFYRSIFQSLQEIGSDRLVSVHLPSRTVVLALFDGRQRRHELKVELPSDYPSQRPTRYWISLPSLRSSATGSARHPPPPAPGSATQLCVNEEGHECDLREPVEGLRACVSFASMVSFFDGVLAHYQDLWDVLDDLDREAIVLEPESVTRACTFRRLALGDHASLLVRISPADPRSIPELRPLGAELRIAPLRKRIMEGLPLWNYTLLPRQSIEMLLGSPLPSPKSSRRGDHQAECGICYSHQLDHRLPEASCDNDKCTALFHQSCLLEWLRALPSSHTSFATTYGTCPYCSAPIQISK